MNQGPVSYVLINWLSLVDGNAHREIVWAVLPFLVWTASAHTCCLCHTRSKTKTTFPLIFSTASFCSSRLKSFSQIYQSPFKFYHLSQVILKRLFQLIRVKCCWGKKLMQDPKFTKSPGCYLCKTVGQTLMLRERSLKNCQVFSIIWDFNYQNQDMKCSSARNCEQYIYSNV